MEEAASERRSNVCGLQFMFSVKPALVAARSAPPSAPESVFDRRGASPLQVYALRPVTNCYCVAVRRGGELQEVNDPSVG